MFRFRGGGGVGKKKFWIPYRRGNQTVERVSRVRKLGRTLCIHGVPSHEAVPSIVFLRLLYNGVGQWRVFICTEYNISNETRSDRLYIFS